MHFILIFMNVLDMPVVKWQRVLIHQRHQRRSETSYGSFGRVGALTFELPSTRHDGEGHVADRGRLAGVQRAKLLGTVPTLRRHPHADPEGQATMPCLPAADHPPQSG